MSDLLPYIDHYFNGELSTEEKKIFEGLCLADPAFARMVAFYISLHDHMLQQWAEQKKQQFAQLEIEALPADEAILSKNGRLTDNAFYEKEEDIIDIHTNEERDEAPTLKEVPFIKPLQEDLLKKGQVKVIPIKRWKWLTLAAALLGVTVTGITLYVQYSKQGNTAVTNSRQVTSIKGSPALNNPSAQNNVVVNSAANQAAEKNETPKKGLDRAEQQRLFAQNFIPDAPPAERSELLEAAFEHYKKGNYKQAIAEYGETQKVVASLTTRAPEDEQEEAETKRILFYTQYYNALSYLATGNTTKAIKELEAIKETPDRYWRNKQQWYLALAYLKKGEITKTTTLLQQVAASKQAGNYRQKAIDLRKTLQE